MNFISVIQGELARKNLSTTALKVLFLLCGFSLLSFDLASKVSSRNLRLISHSMPKKLSENAKTADWHRFNGPSDNASTSETKIQFEWEDDGPPLLWEIQKGEGYSSPVITDGILVLFHRLEGKETIEGRDSETGLLKWIYTYPVEYKDRYGYLDGPRASPVIFDGMLYAHGVTAWLTCLELQTGKLVWKRDLATEFGIPKNFFGKGSNPLIAGNCLVLNLGGAGNQSVVGMDLKTGETKWITLDEWGASYSSPRKYILRGREICLVFAGGESRPSTGGLLMVDPKDGKKLGRFPWRSKSYESVNAVPPVPLAKNRVFLSECYEKGSVILSIDSEFQPRKEWENSDLNIHWMTPIADKSHIYGIAGRHQRGAFLFCLEHETGRLCWKERVSWPQVIDGRSLELELFRGSLLKVEGKFIALSELGSLLSMNINPSGWKIISKSQIFFASGTWTLPALSHGLLYVMQNEVDQLTGKGPRLLCYDLRGE